MMSMSFPFESSDVLALFVLTVLVVTTTWSAFRSKRADERRLFAVSLAMHLVFSQVLLFLQTTIYEESDIWAYYELSTPLLKLLRIDFLTYAPKVVGIIFRVQNDLMNSDSEAGSSTVSMVGLVALGRLITGDSLWTLFALSGYLSCLGKWGIYAACRDELSNLKPRSIALATMCIPSVVFWTSGVVKETYAVAGLGPLFFGMRLLFRAKPSGIAWVLLGAPFVGAFKPYLLFPFAVGAVGWLIFERSKRVRAHAPFYLIVGLLVGGVLFIALSALFPQFSPSNIAEQTAIQQVHHSQAGGGSAYEIGIGDGTMRSQLVMAPVGLLTVLARPFPWEARGVPAFIASAEMVILTFLFLWALLKGKMGAIGAAFVVPSALFCVMFVIIGGTAIGLTTTNFGTLSRYRVPIMPFYAVLVVHLGQYSADARATKKSSAPSTQPLASVTRR